MTTNLLQNPSEINSIIKYPKYTSHASQITPQTEPLFPFLKSTLLPRKKLNVLNDNSAILPIVTPNDLINFPYNINQSGVRNNSVELLKNTTISKKDIDISHYTQDELLQMSIDILTKPVDSRTILDIKMLAKCTSHVKFFEQIGPNIHEKCCKYLRYEKLSPENILFEIGSSGTKFYIILKGSVSILVNLLSDVQETSPKGTITEKKEMQLTEVKISKAGDYFGELALIDNKPRAATIKTLEESYFAVLEKQYYNRILKQSEMKKFYDEVHFYQSISLFNSWPSIAMKFLVYHTEKKLFIRGQIVFRQNEAAEHFFIIKSGEFQFDCKVPINEEIKGVWRKDHRKKKIKTISIELSILSAGSFFGEEELIEDTTRKSTVFCSSHVGELVVVNKKEFNRRFFNDDNTREFLLKHHQVKTQWKENRLKEGINCQRNKEFNQKSIEKDFSTEINIKSDSFDKNRLLTSDKKLLKKEISQTIEINRKINNSTTKNEFYNNKSIDSIYSKKTYKGGYIQDFKTELQGDSFKFSNSLYNNTPSGKSISQFEKNLNISEITKILPKKHYFIKKNSDYDHISSKIKEDSLFKESFIPKEMMKLKAFKKFEEIKENLHYFQEFKGKKKFENISKLELSHKIKKMIQTLQNKTSQNKQKHQKNIDIEIENHVNNVVKQKKHKENTINISNEILTEKKIVKTKEKKQKFLPLKYFANEIHASAQMYLLFPKLQMRIHKKTSSKNSINFLSKEIKIEGRNLSENI